MDKIEKRAPGAGTAVLSADERVALQVYLRGVGIRSGAREMQLARQTLRTALLGGAMLRPSTATVIRMFLALANSAKREGQW